MKSMKKATMIGLEWADEIQNEINEQLDQFSIIEIIPDNFFDINPTQEKFIELVNLKNIPTIIHSVNLSLLSMDSFKESYFQKVMEIASLFKNIYSFSDHLCMTDVGGIQIGQLTSAPYNKDTYNSITNKIKSIQKLINSPFAIENISHPFHIPNQVFSETDFINNLCSDTGCKLLLDLNNVYTNSVNFGENPYKYIDQLNLDNLDSIHLAGGFFDEENILQDGHSQSVPEHVWSLYQYTLEKTQKSIPTIVERTGNNKSEGITPIMRDIAKVAEMNSRFVEERL